MAAPQADSTAAATSAKPATTKPAAKKKAAKTPDSVEIEPITVRATFPGMLKENAPTGAAGAPDWTTARRFSTTRVYLQQADGEVGVEQWYRGRFKHNGEVQNKFLSEVEIGLPYRLQLDIYENWTVSGNRNVEQDAVALEVRYALADWGVIPLNPTLYAEYGIGTDFQDDPNVLELKLLLGEDIAPRWHWGMNFSWEQELSGSRSCELLSATGISYSLIDQVLGIGMEMEFIHTTEHGSRSHVETEFNIGPSIQWRPTPATHLDLVPLFGTTKESPHVEFFAIFGVDFGSIDSKQPEKYTPASLHGH